MYPNNTFFSAMEKAFSNLIPNFSVLFQMNQDNGRCRTYAPSGIVIANCICRGHRYTYVAKNTNTTSNIARPRRESISTRPLVFLRQTEDPDSIETLPFRICAVV